MEGQTFPFFGQLEYVRSETDGLILKGVLYETEQQFKTGTGKYVTMKVGLCILNIAKVVLKHNGEY